MIVGHVCLHDYDAYMHNIQRETMRAKRIPAGETAEQADIRRDFIEAMSLLLLMQYKGRLQTIRDARKEAAGNGQDAKWARHRGGFTDIAWHQELNTLHHRHPRTQSLSPDECEFDRNRVE